MFDATDLIHAYSRADALADGQLIDVSEQAATVHGGVTGFKVPVAMTIGAWHALVAWDADAKPHGAQLSEEQRLKDALLVALESAARDHGSSYVEFIVDVLEPAESGLVVEPKHVVMTIGPGDHHEPVITIMLPGED